MATIEQALAIAVEHHNAGRLDAALELYRRILDVDARNINALHLAGVAHRQKGNLAEAVALIGRSLSIDPSFTHVHNNYANALLAAGRFEDAAAAYRRAIVVDPAFLPAQSSLGSMLCGQGGPDHWAEAVTALRHTARLQPGRAETYHDLGIALRQTERLDEAIDSYRQAIRLRPDFAAGHMSLGNALVEQGDRASAVACFRRGLALRPDSPELYYNLGNGLHALGQLLPAFDAYTRAAELGLNGGLARAGMILLQLGRRAEAEVMLRRSLFAPGGDIASALDLLASLMIEDGRLEEARAFFQQLEQQPLGTGRAHPGECRTALATVELAAGRATTASALLARVTGDNSRFFTVKSIAAFRSTLEELGATLERAANPDPARPRITSSTLATHGRFAHNALEYVMIRLYAEKYGYVVETPDWVGGYYFDLDDPPQSGPLSPLYFPRRIINRLVTGTAGHPPIADCDILSPLFLFEHKEEYRERVQSWLKPRALWRPFLDPAMAALRARGRTVVAVHIRRGDFIQYKYPITETASYVEWLRELWPTLEDPVLYVASDDLEGVRHDFAEFRPLARPDVVPAWPGLDYLQDFHVLMNADVVGISAASGYSMLAARLNTTARLFVEPDMRTRRIRPFAPWV
ncbi:tetratricopeptide repeat protein [Azospirillum sp.]|uniref:tetratricopeptide repeat protein n=1 Tax=Azospirillum sp. TaxID=34012 RepID=UPI003D765B3A